MAITERPRGPLALPSGEPRPTVAQRPLGVFARPRTSDGWRSWVTTVDHKRIGIMYGVAGVCFFLVGGVEALLIRIQLTHPDGKCSQRRPVQPGLHHARRDDDLPRRHADGAAFANYLMPLQIGARDVAFPRLNALQLLVLPVRRPVPQLELAPRRRRRRRLVQLRPEHRRRRSRPATASTSTRWACRSPASRR